MTNPKEITMTDSREDTEVSTGDLTRLTVNLTPRAAEALDRTADRLGDTKTDTVNRALQLYALVTGMSGSEVVAVMVRDGEPLTLVRVGDGPDALAQAAKSIEVALKLLRRGA